MDAPVLNRWLAGDIYSTQLRLVDPRGRFVHMALLERAMAVAVTITGDSVVVGGTISQWLGYARHKNICNPWWFSLASLLLRAGKWRVSFREV